MKAWAYCGGVKKFNQYFYGKHFTLITDHQPVAAIFNPSKSVPAMMAAHLQRWVLFLGAHDYTIEFKGTKLHGNADVFLVSIMSQEKFLCFRIQLNFFTCHLSGGEEGNKPRSYNGESLWFNRDLRGGLRRAVLTYLNMQRKPEMATVWDCFQNWPTSFHCKSVTLTDLV